MSELLAWCGFLGAWLLVGGPVYQAALELQEEEISREDVEAAAQGVPRPDRVSPWWWLLPPVRYVKHRRREQAYRQAVLAVIPADVFEGMIHFGNKATGWLLVGLGGSLIAVKETGDLVAEHEWHGWLLAPVAVAMLTGCLLHTVVRMRTSQRMREQHAQA